jgi:hypothetical protein
MGGSNGVSGSFVTIFVGTMSFSLILGVCSPSVDDN